MDLDGRAAEQTLGNQAAPDTDLVDALRMHSHTYLYAEYTKDPIYDACRAFGATPTERREPQQQQFLFL